MDKFTEAYIEAALWSSMGDDDEPLDRNYDASDLTPETLEKIVQDCTKFQEDNAETLAECEALDEAGDWAHSGRCSVLESAGHDLWLTRNGHGAGFWDGDWPERLDDKLDASAKSFGEVDLYIGDDGLLYI
jgi:hypothetical protein